MARRKVSIKKSKNDELFDRLVDALKGKANKMMLEEWVKLEGEQFQK